MLGRSARNTLGEWLDVWADEDPQGAAFTFLPDRGTPETWTWGELRAAVEWHARRLSERVGPGDRVLVIGPQRASYLVGLLAALRAGAAVIPASAPRSARNAPRLAALLEAGRPRCAVGPAAVGARLAAIEGLALPEWYACDPSAELHRGEPFPSREAASAPALVQFTSGSTGTPKGAVIPQRALLHNLQQIYEAFEADRSTVLVGWCPLQHDMGLIGQLLAPIRGGFRSVVMSPESFVMRPGRWLRAISEYRGTVSGGPDMGYLRCVERVPDAELETLDLSCWKVAYSGAEPVRAETLERFAARFAPVGFDARSFFPCYGLAEATLLCTSAPVGEPPLARDFDPERLSTGDLVPVAEGEGTTLLSMGRPHSGQSVAIVDPVGRQRLPDGTIGEIWVRGPSVAEGYFEREDPAFGAVLADEPGVWLRTGDLGAWTEEEGLFVTGRQKDLIIVGGRNIYPQDVEALAESAHPSVEPAGVIAFGLESGGEERVVVVAELERGRYSSDQLDEVTRVIRSACSSRESIALSDIVLIRRGGLPRTTSGKPRRSECRRLYISGGLGRVEPTLPNLEPIP